MSWNWEIIIVRMAFALGFVAASYHLRPFQLNSLMSIALGAVLGILAVFLEARLERASLKKLIGAVFGSILGVLVALMASHLLNLTLIEGKSLSFIQVALLMLLGYLGLILGANKGDLLNLAALGGVFNGERPVRKSFKILDTSVIIDGRIADVCETGDRKSVV